MEDDESESVVLVVDDEEDIRETFTLYLQNEFEVRTATNGAEAVVELDPDVDVMLLDRRMPEMTGDEVLDHIADMPIDCYVVMVTAVDPDIDIVGMDVEEYIHKPVARDELVGTVEQVLLLDRYEELLIEYFSVTKKHATLESHAMERGQQPPEQLDDLGARRDEIREELTEIVADLDDPIASTLEELHAE